RRTCPRPLRAPVREPMSTFSIGTQNAASINNVAGDMVIHGGLHASAAWSYEFQSEIARALDELPRLPLTASVRASAGDALSVVIADNAVIADNDVQVPAGFGAGGPVAAARSPGHGDDHRCCSERRRQDPKDSMVVTFHLRLLVGDRRAVDCPKASCGQLQAG